MLVTPPADEVGVLPCTTVDVVLDLHPDLHGGPSQVRRGTVEELRAADEVMLLGSVRGAPRSWRWTARPCPSGRSRVGSGRAEQPRACADLSASSGSRPHPGIPLDKQLLLDLPWSHTGEEVVQNFVYFWDS